MISPMYANGVETKTLDQERKPASLILLRFTYTEGMLGPDKKVKEMTWPVATILIPRQAAKGFMKKFFGLMAKEDEYGGPGGKR